MISAGASSRDLIKAFANLTPERVLGGNYKSMALIRKEEGEEKAEQALAILLADTALAFGESLTKEMALYFATEILNAYYWLSLEDCFIVLNRIKRGKLYGKLNLNTFLNAFETYNKERLNMADDLSFSKHLEIKEERPLYERANIIAQTYKVKK
ncbi:hypothetical protein [Carboxylicivirga linearis]|uniref:Uncharacterized protein n=1 Tax=Carboxylicivirga linearis TaxID=1628157 RepID=A0ABS5K0Q3_9BACT|nr:hypothetical protein [Carboxylicivirga linearis]MBS2100690.1 hypothetical protein [Carboxylicivirga linearis]